MISARDRLYQEDSELCIIGGKKIRYRIIFDIDLIEDTEGYNKCPCEENRQFIVNGKQVDVSYEDGFFDNDFRINGIRVLMVKGEKGESGTANYETLENLPALNGITIIGNKTAIDYNFHPVAMSGLIDDLTQESDFIIYCGTATEVV